MFYQNIRAFNIKPIFIPKLYQFTTKNIVKINRLSENRHFCTRENSSQYDDRKYGHDLPEDNVTPCFDTLPSISTGIFRCTVGEVLGRGADKGSYYQNPEYFSFHHMTFYDMHIMLRPYRLPAPKTGRKD